MNEVDNMVEYLVRKTKEAVIRQLKEEGLLEKEVVYRERNSPRTAYGLKGLADYTGVSLYCVARWKKEGKLEGCYLQIGRKITFNLDKIDEKLGWKRKDTLKR